MTVTGVNYSEWTGITSKVSASTEGISQMKPLQFSRTDLSPFVTFSDFLERFNHSIGELKSFTASDVSQMNLVAQNKLSDDANEASAIRSGG